MSVHAEAAGPERKEFPKIAPADVREVAPELAKFTDEVLFGDVWKQPGLSPRDRSLITVSTLVALNRTEQIEPHLNRALDNGVTKEELGALMAHISFYAGWPSGMSGAQRLKKVLDDRAARAKGK